MPIELVSLKSCLSSKKICSSGTTRQDFPELCISVCAHWCGIQESLLYLIFHNIAFKPLCVDTWASIMWYWSTHTLFWQLSIDHNMDVQVAGQSRTQCPTDQKARRLWAQDCLQATTLERFCSSCPVVQTDGHIVAWLPKLIGWIDNQIYYC